MGPTTSLDWQQKLMARLGSTLCSVVSVCIGLARCDTLTQIESPRLDRSMHISEEHGVGQLTGRGFDYQDNETAFPGRCGLRKTEPGIVIMSRHHRRQYRLKWDGGPVVVIEIHCADDTFKLRYDPPLRQTLRRGPKELPFTPAELDWVVRSLRNVVGSAGFSPGRGATAASRASDVPARLADAGDNLFRLVLPQAVQTDLAADSFFVEIGTDEALHSVPWELMYGQEGFICLRHALGRYVNLPAQSDVPRTFDLQGDLKVLLLCIPKPQPSVPGDYERLKEADSEYKTLDQTTCRPRSELVALRADEATKDNVIRVLKDDQRFTIIHFTGHGHVDMNDPRSSGLVLFDAILTTGVLSQFVRHAPVLAFINGCETAKTHEGARQPECQRAYRASAQPPDPCIRDCSALPRSGIVRSWRAVASTRPFSRSFCPIFLRRST